MSGTFPTKAEAQAWATATEADIQAGRLGKWPAKTVRDAFDRYRREVSTHKRGKRAEGLRFDRFERDFPALAGKVLHQVTTADLAEWRDARRAAVADSSVLREINQFRAVWTVAAREWAWCGDPNPWTALKLPKDAPPRVRLMRWREVRAIVRWLGYRGYSDLSVETAMNEQLQKTEFRVENNQMSNLFMVFDVESIGLHGEGFAVGYVVIRRDGVRLEEGLMACDPKCCLGSEDGHRWVAANVPTMACDYRSPRQVRAAFWDRWLAWKEAGAALVADCAWPVEAGFLAAAVRDDLPAREWEGPYPLHDLAPMLLALGRDPLATHDRTEDELPAHQPLNDARQSARLLLEALRAFHTPALGSQERDSTR